MESMIIHVFVHFLTQEVLSICILSLPLLLLLAGRYSAEANEHKKHQRNKQSELSGPYKIISASCLLQTKIIG